MGAAYIEPAQCQGCGICVAECPAKAIQLMHYRDEQYGARSEALLMAADAERVHREERMWSGNDAFEPQIVAFCCHYCAYAAADLAGACALHIRRREDHRVALHGPAGRAVPAARLRGRGGRRVGGRLTGGRLSLPGR